MRQASLLLHHASRSLEDAGPARAGEIKKWGSLPLGRKSRNLNLLCEPQEGCWTGKEVSARRLDSTDSSVSTREGTGWGWHPGQGRSGVSSGDTSRSHKLHQAMSGEASVLDWGSDPRFKEGWGGG